MSGRSGYASLLGTHGARSFTAAALVGRMPIAMLGIGTVLLVEDRRGSYALAGAVSAAYALGLAVLGPAVSRLVDRRGQRRVLPWSVVLTAVGIVVLVLLAGADVPAWTLLPAAAVMSASASQLGACARARWSFLLARRPAELERAFAWEAVVDEMVFVLGPLLVVLCALVDPALGLLLALVLTTAGTAWFIAQRGTEPAVVVRTERHPPAMRSPGLRVVVAAMVFVGVLFGTVEVSMVAFAEQRGSTSGAGVLLALVALGSAVAGLVYGSLRLTSPLPRRFRFALGLLAVGMLPMLLAPTVELMAPAALLAGIAISPTLICAYGLTEALVPPASRTEGFSWLNTGLGVGVALGFAVSGAVAEAAGARVALLLALGGALLAGAVAGGGRRPLAVRGTGDPRCVHPAVPGTSMPYAAHASDVRPGGAVRTRGGRPVRRPTGDAMTEPQDDAARASSPETDVGAADAVTGTTDEGQIPPTAVPSPGGPDSSAAPGTAAAAAIGVDEDATASPGGWTAIAVPGSPDGEVDTRS